MNNTTVSPGVGVAVLIWQDRRKEKFLLGLGHDPANRSVLYAVPGGHWESGETLVQAARRETLEEAAIEIGDISFVSVYDFYREDKRRSYVSIWFQAIRTHGEPRVMEPQNKISWGWYSPREALKLPLWHLDRVLIDRVLSGTVYEVGPDLPLIGNTPSLNEPHHPS